MRRRVFIVVAILLGVGRIAYAHRLDEYLQATILSVGRDRIEASMRMIPGVAVSSSIIASIDSDHDGSFSNAEQAAYAQRVLGDLSLRIDDHGLDPHLVSFTFPEAWQMKEGLGEIHITFTADVPAGGPGRRFVLENHHLAKDSAYLVNSLVPNDPAIRIITQKRNERQSFYEVEYTQGGALTGAPARNWWRAADGWSLASFARNGEYTSLFRLGMRHIAEGTDHLLFLLVLLLPAPLISSGSRWLGIAGMRDSLVRILRIVTAFTIGHSITLGLAALGFVHAATRPVEILIAVSILVSAVHAIRPIFPGKEAAIAAFFGLIHGLAFAATLSHLGLDRWERVAGIFAFNLGIETMQLLVVAATVPSLFLLSRTPAYSYFRTGGAVFAGLVSAGWIAERSFGRASVVDVFVNAMAHQAGWVAGALFLLSVICPRRSASS